MDQTASNFLDEKHEEFAAFRRALSMESDRGCALFAAAYLDSALSDLLSRSFVNSRSIANDLFEGNAPLSAFSSRIKMAFYLGVISEECRTDLDTIRKIRNDFAHEAGLISFDSQSIADRCRNLGFSYHSRDARPRAHFTSAASGILATVHVMSFASVAPKARPDDRPTEAEKMAAREDAKKAVKSIEVEIKRGAGDANA